MSERYVEKSFLYLLVFSLLLHVALFLLIVLLPAVKPEMRQEPLMIDLEDIPDVREAPRAVEREARRQAEQRRRVPRESAPKGGREQERIASLPPAVPATRPPAAPARRPVPFEPAESESRPPAERGRAGDIPVREAPRGGGVLKPRSEQAPETSQLMPGAQRMARLEESYRKKYSSEVAEGETKFLDTDDIQFGSFLRRFENSIYGVWRYPQEAARLGVEGVTPVKITFNSKGEIERFEILQSSGSRILDSEVERTLRLVGPVGPFPKGYTKDKFYLIAFFQYGIVRGSSRGTLH